MKYTNKRNGQVAELVEQDERTKMVHLQLEDGKFTAVTISTFKRWWKKLDVEQAEVQEVAPVEEASVEVVPKAEIVEEICGDGTPLKEVGKEIAKQAKKKSKQAKKGKSKKSKMAAIGKDGMRDKLIQAMEEAGVSYVHPDHYNLEFLIDDTTGKKSIGVYLGAKKAVLLFKVTSVPENARPDRVRNCPFSHAFDIYPDKMDRMVKLLQERR